MPPGAEPLPIDPLLPGVADTLLSAGRLVLKAPPGAGKTTRVPPALLAAGLEGRILVLEPRRIAARAAARRIASEWGWRVGDTVGYQVRFDSRSGPDTRILCVTEGILLRVLQGDPLLDGIGAILFDEFHERSLDADLGLALAKRVRDEVRPDLKILVMSATLDAGPIAKYLDDAPSMESEGRLHPVTVEWEPRRERERLEAAMTRGIRRAIASSPGDVLAFLPGVGEIHRTARSLRDAGADRGAEIFPLHGSLSPSEQDAVFEALPHRKIVLATNVAETSLTVPGVTAVVDSGLAKILRYDAGPGLDRLELSPVSRASAEQRAGRAGRERPGLCVRLWTEHEHRGRPAREEPEIRRVDLTGAVLQLLAWGETDLDSFPWLEPPREASLRDAIALLEGLGAVDERGVTAEGRILVRFPVHPRLARLLVEGHARGFPVDVSRLAALLAERDPFPRVRRDTPPAPGPSDLWPRLEALEAFTARGEVRETPYGRLKRGAAGSVLAAAEQLERLLAAELGPAPEPSASREEALSRALLAAYPDRVALRREPRSDRVLLVGGRGARAGRDSAVRTAPLSLALDLVAGRRGEGAEAWVRLATELDESWLPAVRESLEHVFDPDRERVVARKRRTYRDLVLREVEAPVSDAERAAGILAEAAAGDLEGALALERDDVGRFLARVRCLAEWRPELGLPRFDREDLLELMPSLCAGKRSFDELRSSPLVEVLSGTLSYEQRKALETEAPERLEVPSGSHISLQWAAGEPPVLAVRIQEMFGAANTPTVAGGRVRVLLHLLAPNFRPQQITDDLTGFWDRTYPEVRKELAGRYPKHSWPDDPRSATPEAKGGRRG